MNHLQVRDYMKDNLNRYREQDGDINVTALGDAAAEQFGLYDPNDIHERVYEWVYNVAFYLHQCDKWEREGGQRPTAPFWL